MSTLKPRQRVQLRAPGYVGKLGYALAVNGTSTSKWTGITLQKWLVQVDGIATPITFVESELEAKS